MLRFGGAEVSGDQRPSDGLPLVGWHNAPFNKEVAFTFPAERDPPSVGRAMLASFRFEGFLGVLQGEARAGNAFLHYCFFNPDLV